MARKRANGEGSILKRKDGRFMARVTVNGERLTFYSRSRQEAAAWLAEQLAAKNHGLLVAPSKVTFGQWLDTWLQEYARPRVRPTTWEDYRIIVEKHLKPALGEILLKDLRPEHLQKVHNEKAASGLSPRRVRLIHVVTHSALKQAVKSRLLAVNPAEATSLPRQPKREIHVLSLEDEKKLLAALEGERLGVFFLVALATGLRRGELLGLKWEDVDLKNGVIKVRRSLTRVKTAEGKTELVFQEPKTESSRRMVPLPSPVVSALKAHRRKQAEEKLLLGQDYQDNGFVFCHEDGRPLDPAWVTRNFHRLLKKAGVNDTNFHALRHTYATRLLELNEHPKVVQELLGHSSIEMTLDTYSHVMPEIKQAAVQKLDALFAPAQNKSPLHPA